MRLTGNEPWVMAGTQGATVWARKWGAKDWWWPIVDVELDCGLITIDVCGEGEVWDLVECAELRINDEPPICNDGIWDVPNTALTGGEAVPVESTVIRED